MINGLFDHLIQNLDFTLTGKIIPSVFFDRESGKNLILEHTRRFRTSKGILVNTFSELESVGINALLDMVAKDKIPAVYPVGPILELDNKSRSGSKGQNHEYIIDWLNDQPSSSVVFLCFGSMGSFDEAQVKEIANGLENSGHRFLWSLRKPPPEGKYFTPSIFNTLSFSKLLSFAILGCYYKEFSIYILRFREN